MLRRFFLCGAAAVLSACDKLGTTASSNAPSFRAVDITGAEYARQLDLVDQNGQPRTLADFKGKVTVVFFGYTQCPDVCPTTMAELAQIKKSLGKDGEGLETIRKKGLDPLKKSKMTRASKDPREHFQWPLALAAALLFAEMLVNERRRRRAVTES